jgi:hypothetical protein
LTVKAPLVVFGSAVLAAAVRDACGAQDAEGDGVAAGFGEEVAAEAEHVCPALEPGEVGVPSEAPAGGDEAFGVGAGGVGHRSILAGVRRREAWPVTLFDLVAYLAR